MSRQWSRRHIVPPDERDAEEREPLLRPERNPDAADNRLGRLRKDAAWLADAMADRNTLKCLAVWLGAACVCNLWEPVRDVLGSSAYLACTNVIIFHPGKTVGTMVEAGMSALAALAFGSGVSLGCLKLAEALGDARRETTHSLCLAILFCCTLLLAYIKATVGQRRPAVSSATNVALMLLFVTLTRIANEALVPVLPRKVLQSVLSVVGGIVLSIAGALLLWPETSSRRLLENLGQWASEQQADVSRIAAAVARTADATDDGDATRRPALARALAQNDKRLLSLRAAIHEVRYELCSRAHAQLPLLRQVERQLGRLGATLCGLDSVAHLALSGPMPDRGTFPFEPAQLACQLRLAAVGLDVAAAALREKPVESGDPEQALPNLPELAEQVAAEMHAFDNEFLAAAQEFAVRLAPSDRRVLVYFAMFQVREIGLDLVALLNALVAMGSTSRRPWVRCCGPEIVPTGALWQPGLVERLLSLFKARHAKHALKTAAAIVVLAAPAFVDEFQPTFLAWRLHWMLTTAVVVMTPSVGASNLMGLYRLLGTAAGALLGLVAWATAGGYGKVGVAVALAAVGSVGWALFLHSAYPKISQIALLTFTVVFLGKFATSHDPTFGDAPIALFAFQRAMAVGLGIVAGLAVTHLVWPFRARREVRKGLAAGTFELCLLYSRLTAKINHPLRAHPVDFQPVEDRVRVQLAELRQLLGDTASEPHPFKRFQRETYTGLISSCERILGLVGTLYGVLERDTLPADNSLAGTTIDSSASSVAARRAFLTHVEPARKALLAEVALCFYVASACLRMKHPVPPQWPNPRAARRRLLLAVRVWQQHAPPSQDGGIASPLRVFYVGYVLLLQDLVSELEEVAQALEALYGSIPYRGMEDASRSVSPAE